jgi:hypothetical protein
VDYVLACVTAPFYKLDRWVPLDKVNLVCNTFIQTAKHKSDMNLPLSCALEPSMVSSDDYFLALTED